MFMAYWQTSIPRQPAKTKAELREMLTEAVRNTQPRTAPEPPRKRRSKAETNVVAEVD